MARVTCSRCFTVFDGEARRGVPLCPACTEALPPLIPEEPGTGPVRPLATARRRGLAPRIPIGPLLLGLGALGLAVAGGLALKARSHRQVRVVPEPSAIELEVGVWRAEKRVQASGEVEAHLAAGRRALLADLPARTAEARREFMEALALSPGDAEALAGYVTAFAWLAGSDADAAELAAFHRMVRWALPRAAGRADLHAALAHLLLLTPGDANGAEALAEAQRAQEVGPDSAPALLALGHATMARDPRAAAAWLEKAAERWPAERRALTLAARARWRAGEAGPAMVLLTRRLRPDPGQPEALELQAEIEAATGRMEAARATLQRWARVDPRSPRPWLDLGRIAAQWDGDLPAARRLLQGGMALAPDDFLAARLLAHLAAVERVSGDFAAAGRGAAEALRRVPGSAPARYQAAVLAYRRRDFFALRQSADVLGQRGGERTALVLSSWVAELDGRTDEAIAAQEAAARLARTDLRAQLVAAGALAKLGAAERALAAAAVAAAIDPVDARARRSLEEFWEGPGPLTEAADLLAKLADRDPRIEAQAAAAAATCQILLGRPRAALELARRARAAEPQWARPRLLAAQAFLDMGRPRDALAEVEAAAATDAVAAEVRARALEGLGRGREALEAHQNALRLDPALHTAQLGEALLLARLGDGARARQILARLLAAEPGYALARGALLEP